jgi:large subunit ribosomal protein L4
MKSILSLKMKEDRLKIIENFTIESGKTKELVSILKNLVKDERTVLVIGGNDEMLRRAGRNIPWLTFLAFNQLNAHDLFYGRKILILENAAEKLNSFYAETKN